MILHRFANSYQVWVCIMFAALNIDRNNILNAVSDNMLEDLDLTKADYVGWPLKRISPIWTLTIE